MIRRPPRSTRTSTLCPTRRASDLRPYRQRSALPGIPEDDAGRKTRQPAAHSRALRGGLQRYQPSRFLPKRHDRRSSYPDILFPYASMFLSCVKNSVVISWGGGGCISTLMVDQRLTLVGMNLIDHFGEEYAMRTAVDHVGDLAR